ncbi:4'-phosphopantetheinyl transferase sfp [Rubripirellula tenax]|uniref:4'-phosphopantetheinyl transferase sfp n=1 Tax=Rubripirellula tenax TaxID=2528015 RepID=A0A5C6FAK3_9BACT|nr:4'-phosphopantetheinyl transferase superfamily protein [Rubripirellula tenax]TWU58813.1 4'-phosphopantetheinyl transferase sfp [Rubripirellula tenax]
MTSDPPNTETVRVWHATSSSGPAGPIERHCESWLDESERQRADRFRQPTSRNQHVIGRGMARQLLGANGIPPDAIRFDIETYGKPFVIEPDTARRPFNVAHTDGLVMCGIADRPDSLVGVDIERLDRRTDPGLADRYFSKPEIEFLKTCGTGDARRAAFLRIWTLKESFIKAIGTGLQTPLADFAFEEIESDSPKIRMLDPKLESDRQWQFYCVAPRPGFIGAVAVAPGQAATLALELHSFDELVST